MVTPSRSQVRSHNRALVLPRNQATATVFMDESGSISSDRFFAVGALKIIQPNHVVREVRNLCNKRHFAEEMHFSRTTRGDLPLYRDIVSIVEASGATFSCFVADRKTADPIARFGSSWAAYEKLAVQLLHASLSRGELVHVLTDQYDTPADQDFEASVRTQVNRRLRRLAVIEVNKLDSRATRGLQVVDLLTSAIAFEFRASAGVGKTTSPKGVLAQHVRDTFGVSSALLGCLGPKINVRLYNHGSWSGPAAPPWA